METLAKHNRPAGCEYAVLTPNLKGYQAAQKSGAEEVAIFGAASESFSQRNINCSIKESLERFTDVAQAADTDNIRMRGLSA